MDHRDLLKRYIKRVWDSEGETFIPSAPGERTVGGAPTVDFTVEEIAELRRLEEEAEEEDRSRFAATVALLEEIGVMDTMREQVREDWRRVEDHFIHGDGTGIPYGILSRSNGYAGSVTISHSHHIPVPIPISEMLEVPSLVLLDEGNRHERRKRRRMQR
jgi:hypothetical protein